MTVSPATSTPRAATTTSSTSSTTAAKAPKPIQVSKVFVAPTFEMSIPDNLGRPPTSNDVIIKKGFDGRSVDQFVDVVRGQFKPSASGKKLDPANDRLVRDTLSNTFKAFTIGVNNAYNPKSPISQLAARYPGAKLTVLGTMSQVNPYVVRIDRLNQPPLLFTKSASGFTPIATNPYQVVVQAEIQTMPTNGIRMGYPVWQAKNLEAPAGATITEGSR